MINKFDIKILGVVTSTQDVGLELAKKKQIAHGDVIIAEAQKNGRGRRGRKWESNSGNLFMTIALKPVLEENYWSQISYVTVVSLSEAIIQIAPSVDVDLKWVNDLLVEGKKIAGIILEKSYPGLLFIGIGVNLIKDELLSQYNATALEEWSEKFTKDKLIKVFLSRFKNHYNDWLKNGFPPIKNLWMKRAIALGQNVIINLLDREEEGVFIGIDDNGSMQLLSHGRIEIIKAGDMYYL